MEKKEQYDVQDFGIIGPDNALWLNMDGDNAVAVNALRPGQTAYITFRTGMGTDTVRVTRLNDRE